MSKPVIQRLCRCAAIVSFCFVSQNALIKKITILVGALSGSVSDSNYIQIRYKFNINASDTVSSSSFQQDICSSLPPTWFFSLYYY